MRLLPLNLDLVEFPLVSIIIPHFKGIETLSECIDSVNTSTYLNREIIIVDNASGDGSPEWVEENHPDIILVKNKLNEGYAGGCNRGAELANGDFLMFLNNDTIHINNWVELLVEEMLSDPNTAAVQPKILNYYNTKIFDYAGGCGGAIDVLAFPFARGRLFNSQEVDSKQYDNEKNIFWASGTALLVRKTDFDRAGRFDETFFAHQEEIDLQWKFHLMGRNVKVVPESVVYHKNAVTLPAKSIRKQYLNHRNSILMLISNYSLPMVIYLLPIRLALELIAIIYALFLFDFRHVAGIMKSLAWILFHPKIIYLRRQHTKSLRKINDRKILSQMHKGSIVLDYFILRKKNYRDLFPIPS